MNILLFCGTEGYHVHTAILTDKSEWYLLSHADIEGDIVCMSYFYYFSGEFYQKNLRIPFEDHLLGWEGMVTLHSLTPVASSR